jgi:hypothetical protein
LAPARGGREPFASAEGEHLRAPSLGASLKRPGFSAVPQFFEHSLFDFPNLRHTVLGGKTAEGGVDRAGMVNGTIPAPKQLDVRSAHEARAPAEAAMETAQSRDSGGLGSAKKKRPWGSAQVLEKARSGQGNPSFSFGCLWPGFAGFGRFWLNLVWAWIFLGPPRPALGWLGDIQRRAQARDR